VLRGKVICHQFAVLMFDLGNVLFTLIPHFIRRGSVGLTMKLTRICLISFGCVSAALAFGFLAHTAIDRVLPAQQRAAVEPAKPVEAAPAPAAFQLAAAASAPAEIAPVKVKTIPMIFREDAVAQAPAVVPLPRPRPLTAPGIDSVSSVSRQPASLAIAAATRANPDNGDPLGAAGIERMKLALALTAEQEEFWPAIAAELQALGKVLQKSKGQKVSVDSEAVQRLYWAAAPLITRLSYEQKLKVKQMAHIMGLHQVAEAL
jgi:hypothetical protein